MRRLFRPLTTTTAAVSTRRRAAAATAAATACSRPLSTAATSTTTTTTTPPTSSTTYVSPHDWKALVRDYGKSDSASASANVEIHTLIATARSDAEAGSRSSRRLREQGKLPGVLYGPGADGDKERYLITVEKKDIEKQMRRLGDSIGATVFELQLATATTTTDGAEGTGEKGGYKPQRVLIRDLDRDPGTALPIAVNFLRYRPGFPVEVPVCFVNEELCLPLKRGGMLLSINRFIRVTCEGETIPEMLLVDLTGVRNNQKVGIERVNFPSGVQPHEVKEDYVLGVVKGKNVGGPAAAAEEAAAAE